MQVSFLSPLRATIFNDYDVHTAGYRNISISYVAIFLLKYLTQICTSCAQDGLTSAHNAAWRAQETVRRTVLVLCGYQRRGRCHSKARCGITQDPENGRERSRCQSGKLGEDETNVEGEFFFRMDPPSVFIAMLKC